MAKKVKIVVKHDLWERLLGTPDLMNMLARDILLLKQDVLGREEFITRHTSLDDGSLHFCHLRKANEGWHWDCQPG
jgi:hypothetical protein